MRHNANESYLEAGSWVITSWLRYLENGFVLDLFIDIKAGLVSDVLVIGKLYIYQLLALLRNLTLVIAKDL